MPVLHQSKLISKDGPSSLRQVWAEYKDKVPDVSDITRFKDLRIKITERLLSTEIVKL